MFRGYILEAVPGQLPMTDCARLDTHFTYVRAVYRMGDKLDD